MARRVQIPTVSADDGQFFSSHFDPYIIFVIIIAAAVIGNVIAMFLSATSSTNTSASRVPSNSVWCTPQISKPTFNFDKSEANIEHNYY